MKSPVHQYFDKVFVLNLKSEFEKKDAIRRKFDALNIEFDFFEGINGYSHEFTREWQLYNSRPKATSLEKSYGKKFIESRGAWGYLKTMIALLTHALQQKYNRILVFDNDCLFPKDFDGKFSRFMGAIDNNWRLVLLGASQYKWQVEMNTCYYHPIKFGTCGSFAIGYDRSVFAEIIAEAKTMETPFDNLPLGKAYEKYKKECFVAFPNITIADVRQSLIRVSRDIVEHSKGMKWELSEFEIFTEQSVQ